MAFNINQNKCGDENADEPHCAARIRDFAASPGGVSVARKVTRFSSNSARALRSATDSSRPNWTHAEHRNELECVEWPVTRMNTIINVCPQGEHIILERFDAFHREVEPGLLFAIPGVDNVAFCICKNLVFC